MPCRPLCKVHNTKYYSAHQRGNLQAGILKEGKLQEPCGFLLYKVGHAGELFSVVSPTYFVLRTDFLFLVLVNKNSKKRQKYALLALETSLILFLETTVERAHVRRPLFGNFFFAFFALSRLFSSFLFLVSSLLTSLLLHVYGFSWILARNAYAVEIIPELEF